MLLSDDLQWHNTFMLRLVCMIYQFDIYITPVIAHYKRWHQINMNPVCSSYIKAKMRQTMAGSFFSSRQISNRSPNLTGSPSSHQVSSRRWETPEQVVLSHSMQQPRALVSASSSLETELEYIWLKMISPDVQQDILKKLEQLASPRQGPP